MSAASSGVTPSMLTSPTLARACMSQSNAIFTSRCASSTFIEVETAAAKYPCVAKYFCSASCFVGKFVFAQTAHPAECSPPGATVCTTQLSRPGKRDQAYFVNRRQKKQNAQSIRSELNADLDCLEFSGRAQSRDARLDGIHRKRFALFLLDQSAKLIDILRRLHSDFDFVYRATLECRVRIDFSASSGLAPGRFLRRTRTASERKAIPMRRHDRPFMRSFPKPSARATPCRSPRRSTGSDSPNRSTASAR